MFYTLIETQIIGGATAVVPPTTYTDTNAALAAAYTALAAASVSSCEYHSVLLIDANGFVIEPSRVFDRRKP